jgi:hypothetical protein
MKTIVIFSNCAGEILKYMFETHNFTKDKFSIHYIVNYENLDKKLNTDHINLLNKCDIFIYQPFNRDYSDSEYDVTNLTKHLRPCTIMLKVNYYRFKGFWYDSEYKPYNKYNNYQFLNRDTYGIHNSFINFHGNKNDIIDKINNIWIEKNELVSYFDNELEKFKKIDDNSDVNMFDYFINNYKIKRLFHDPFHPTNLFFYEIFRQIIVKLLDNELKYEDNDFIASLDCTEMTHWALPILPIVRTHLELELPDTIWIFSPPYYGDKKYCMDIYDYYYVRLSPENFKKYQDNHL